MDALITQQSSETDAYAKFDSLSNDRLNELRKRHQKLQVKSFLPEAFYDVFLKEVREEQEPRSLQRAIDGVETTLEAEYLPALMAQAKLLWEKAQWAQIERLFRRSAEFCRGNETWKLNLAHTLFMQEKFKESRWELNLF